MTDDEENKNAKVNLINKLVEIKEKYNKLINEKYELEYRVKKMEKKIKSIKEKIIKIKNLPLNNTWILNLLYRCCSKENSVEINDVKNEHSYWFIYTK